MNEEVVNLPQGDGSISIKTREGMEVEGTKRGVVASFPGVTDPHLAAKVLELMSKNEVNVVSLGNYGKRGENDFDPMANQKLFDADGYLPYHWEPENNAPRIYKKATKVPGFGNAPSVPLNKVEEPEIIDIEESLPSEESSGEEEREVPGAQGETDVASVQASSGEESPSSSSEEESSSSSDDENKMKVIRERTYGPATTRPKYKAEIQRERLRAEKARIAKIKLLRAIHEGGDIYKNLEKESKKRGPTSFEPIKLGESYKWIAPPDEELDEFFEALDKQVHFQSVDGEPDVTLRFIPPIQDDPTRPWFKLG